MQYVENDMDELFRKAAENYPLKTDMEGWDDIAPVLIKTPASNIPGRKSKRKNTWIMLLVFLFAATTASIVLLNQHAPVTDTASAVDPLKKDTGGDKANANGNTSSQKQNAQSMDLAIESTYPVPRRNRVVQKDKLVTLVQGKQERMESLLIDIENAGVQNQSAVIAYSDSHNISGTDGTGISSLHGDQPGSVAINDEPTKDKENILSGSDNSQKKLVPDLTGNKSKRSSKFYFGIVAGSQLNEVKGQSFSKPGLSAGVLAGYSLDKKVSIETGIFYSKKHYYSEGKYFDMVKASPSMPPSMEVISLKGKSTVFEIPVNVRYDFGIKAKSNLFLAAGVSSYILTKENNDYLALINGNQQRMEGNYQHAARYFAAAINLSVGYNYKIGKQVSVRAEPYLQVPIKGIGVGSIPVTSAGLHIGIIWNNHK